MVTGYRRTTGGRCSFRGTKSEKMISRFSYVCLLGVSFALFGAGCERDDSLPAPSEPRRDGPLSQAEVSRDAFPATSSNGQAAASRDAFLTSAEKKLKEVDAEIADLSRKAADFRDDSKVRAEQALSSLREQRANVAGRVEQLKAASADAWQDLKTGFDAAVTEMEKTFEDVKRKFRQGTTAEP